MAQRPDDVAEIARASYLAYVRKDRAAIEALIADDFSFTSPLDNKLNRAAYFARCWPNSEAIADFQFNHLVADDDRVFVIYQCRMASGRIFQNCEVLTIRDRKIHAAEVYFGWNVPHEAPEGRFVSPPADQTGSLTPRK